MVNERQIRELEHCDIPKKKIALALEIGLRVNERQFSKTAITKNDTFFTKANINISIY